MIVLTIEPTSDNIDAISKASELISGTRGLSLSAYPIKDGKQVALLVSATPFKLAKLHYAQRLTDWMHGVGSIVEEPTLQPDDSMLTTASRLRLLYDFITNPTFAGGLGVNSVLLPGLKVFALHDPEFNVKWIKSWASKFRLNDSDILMVRDQFGEKVALYFGFLDFYLKSLVVPTCVSSFFMNAFTTRYALLISVWALFMQLLWKKREEALAQLFDTTGVSRVETIRQGFMPKAVKTDPVSGEEIPWYPQTKRYAAILLYSLPAMILSLLATAVVILLNLAVEMYVANYYSGPLKGLVSLLPPIAYAISVPRLVDLVGMIMTKVNNRENRQGEQEHNNALGQKIFSISACVTYLNLYAIAFVFIPLNDWISPGATWNVQPEMLTSRLFYYVVTGQIVNTVQEAIVPYFLPKVEQRVKDLMGKGKVSSDSKLIRRIEREADLAQFDPFEDYSEMVIQYGFITLFGISWPHTFLACLMNNFVELRSDAFKLVTSFQRPIGIRLDRISPWTENLFLLSWGGFALAALYGNWDETKIPSEQVVEKLPVILAAVFLSEHVYLAAGWGLRSMLGSEPSKDQEKRRKRFAVKKSKMDQRKILNGNDKESIEFGIVMHTVYSVLSKKPKSE